MPGFLKKSYTTHIPMLIRALQLTTEPVLELGAGAASTPLIHWLCSPKHRHVVTYEDSESFYRFAYQFTCRTHRVVKVDDWETIPIENTDWGVVLVDHGWAHRADMAVRRSLDAIRVKDKAELILLHDSQTPEIYGYDELWPLFKYVYHWKFAKPWTSAVSNIRDVRELE